MKSRHSGLALILFSLAIASSCGTQNSSSSVAEPPCDIYLENVVSQIRQMGDASDQDVDRLFDNECEEQRKVYTDYTGVLALVDVSGVESCQSWSGVRIDRQALQLARDTGKCTGELPDDRTSTGNGSAHDSSVAWDDAVNHIGEVGTVCGPFADYGNSNDDVFLDLGNAYPDPNRFTIVLWDSGPVEKPEIGTKLCVSGEIVEYKGMAQIHPDDVSDVRIHD